MASRSSEVNFTKNYTLLSFLYVNWRILDVNTGWPLSRQREIPSHFSDGLRYSSAALGMLSVTHIVPVLVLNTGMDTNMQLTVNRFKQLFSDKISSLTLPWRLVKSLTFPWQLSNSRTFPGFLDKRSPWYYYHSASKQPYINTTECIGIKVSAL